MAEVLHCMMFLAALACWEDSLWLIAYSGKNRLKAWLTVLIQDHRCMHPKDSQSPSSLWGLVKGGLGWSRRCFVREVVDLLLVYPCFLLILCQGIGEG